MIALPQADQSTISFEPINKKELATFFKENKNRFHEMWIIITKKDYANPQPLSFTEAVNEAIKQGLIDSKTKTFSKQKYGIRFTKRKAAKIESK